MIIFDPLWQLLKERNITTYDLEYVYGLNPADTSRLKNNHNYTLKSIDRFCHLFSCQPGEILLYKDSKEFYIPSNQQISTGREVYTKRSVLISKKNSSK